MQPDAAGSIAVREVGRGNHRLWERLVFEVEVTEQDGWTILMPVGDLDLASAPALRSSLHRALAASDGQVVVDLEGVHFVDSQGLGTLVGGLKRARSRGGDLRLAAPSAELADLLALTSLDRAFVVTAEVSEAIALTIGVAAGRD